MWKKRKKERKGETLPPSRYQPPPPRQVDSVGASSFKTYSSRLEPPRTVMAAAEGSPGTERDPTAIATRAEIASNAKLEGEVVGRVSEGGEV